MQVKVDMIARRNYILEKTPQRNFILQCPADADLPEIYGVLEQENEEIWKAIEEEKKRKKEQKEPSEKCEKQEVPVENK